MPPMRRCPRAVAEAIIETNPVHGKFPYRYIFSTLSRRKRERGGLCCRCENRIRMRKTRGTACRFVDGTLGPIMLGNAPTVVKPSLTQLELAVQRLWRGNVATARSPKDAIQRAPVCRGSSSLSQSSTPQASSTAAIRSRLDAETGINGSRTWASSNPIISIAALTGCGFGSQKLISISGR